VRIPYWLGGFDAWQGLVHDGSWEYILDEEDRQHKQTHNKEPKPLAVLSLHAPIVAPLPSSVKRNRAEKGAKKGLLLRSQPAYIASCLTNQGTPKKLRDSYNYKKTGTPK
jgi:hypothetical protein